MTGDRMDPALEEAFEHLRQVPDPDTSRQADQRAALLEGAHRYRAAAACPGTRRWALVGALVAIVLVLVAGTGGIVYAADVAVPGDMLYGMDRALESARLALTSQPQAAADLLWAFAGERMAEAEALNAKEAQESDGDEQDGDGSDPCVGADPHPVGESLAEAYDVDYETIMGWFCDDGFGFGEIMHALEAADELGMDPEDVLAQRAEKGWGQIWQELGLKGKPDDAGPPDDDGNGDDQDDPGDDDQDDPGDDDQDDQNGDDQDDQDDDDQDDQDGDDQDGDDQDDDEQDACVGADPQPTGQRLADAYDVDYETIMKWFCDDGFGFGEIKHALEAAKVLELDPEDVLAMRSTMGWGQIWQELGLKGKPDDEDKKDQDKPNGPPDDKEKKDKEDKSNGPPDDKEKKDKEDKSNGPPDDKVKKDKEVKPSGPPADKDKKDKKDKGDKKDKSGG